MDKAPTCGHSPEAATCGHSINWLPMAAGGCQWLRVAARGCECLQVAASGCQWRQAWLRSKEATGTCHRTQLLNAHLEKKLCLQPKRFFSRLASLADASWWSQVLCRKDCYMKFFVAWELKENMVLDTANCVFGLTSRFYMARYDSTMHWRWVGVHVTCDHERIQNH